MRISCGSCSTSCELGIDTPVEATAPASLDGALPALDQAFPLGFTSTTLTPALGTEWLVDAHGCDPSSLRSQETLEALFARVVRELGLYPMEEAVWHVFPGEGGVTGLLLLRESHLACHTFPERGFAAFDLYCCRPREEWPWAERLAEALGARRVSVRVVARGGA